MTGFLIKLKDFCIVSYCKQISMFLGVLLPLFLASCFKKDTPITNLPPKTGTNFIQVQMGPAHDSTFYINLEQAKVVGKSLHYSWDLKFESSETGSHVMLNSGKSTRAFKTNVFNINEITSLPTIADGSWGYDAPTLTPDSTYIGDWWQPNNTSNMNVYIIRLANKQGNFTYKKIQFVNVDATKYTIRFADINSTNFTSLNIPKNDAYNFTFFSFDNNGQILAIEPPKTDWDVQVTRFSHVYYNLTPIINYQVNGMLSNNYKTLSAGDTLNQNNFATFSLEQVKAMDFYPFPNAIGLLGRILVLAKALMLFTTNICTL